MAAKKGSPKKPPAKKPGKGSSSKAAAPAQKKSASAHSTGSKVKSAAAKSAPAPVRKPPASNWFEIPASDFDRARKFYGDLLGQTLPTREWRGVKMAFIDGYPGGAVVAGEGYVPMRGGALVYLNAGDDLSDILPRVEPGGGKLEHPKTMISPDHGYFAVFTDTEGNRVALHSMK